MTNRNRPSYTLEQNSHTLFRSAIHTMGMFVYFAQQRFSTNKNPVPFPWTSDENTTKIYIGSYLERDGLVRTFFPRIVATRGSIVSSRVVQGDIDQYQPDLLTRGQGYGYRQHDLDIRYEIFAEAPGEAELIGDILFSAVDFSRQEILQEFMLRDISAVIQQPVRPVGKTGEEKYQCNIEFRITYEVRWAHLDSASELKQVKLSTLQEGGLNYVNGIILRDSDLPEP